MIEASASGKLYLAGEYAVVEAGYPAVIAAVEQRLVVSLQQAEKGTIRSTQNPELEVFWSRQEHQIYASSSNPYQLIISSMQVVEDYVRTLGVDVSTVYRIAVRSDLDDQQSGAKYGLGSSGAVTVAVIRALLAYYQQEIVPILVYKLAAIAQLKNNMTGSFGDLATSSFGGVISYHSVDRAWLKAAIKHASIRDVIEQDWKDLAIELLELPDGLELLVGWTGAAASTDQLVAAMHRQLTQEEKELYHQQFLAENRLCVEKLIQACKENDAAVFEEAIAVNRQQLRDFSVNMGIVIETSQLTRLCQLAKEQGAVAKSSGAGGGDCGICFVRSLAQKETICRAWEGAGIKPLPLSIACRE
ncbi:phosphomevalonate kinase [Streptococcus sp. zg-86]|uniref:phosphomevalonate kinase n=1 Tax=Streptococcus zhangguiae TaxID=2664091 RepID=A0A6I4RFS2_9STRE|nr:MULTISPECIES: phosphomevalonate kinase [unclassified Streptococcus]MTB63611.1 phosphomevalonate kinase [Streptococcus sp. zg-86]MTB89740.1 phosphomevalonate kinase [Streptococcus sp. zg-36]MWV55411.1 phosphomevalonate kinase [Streptococcus sp. zg-70]QTH47607.1 phosphomevalonate kinase [Streptococcus sp. zg-86]